jgi:hypothetical protein
MAVAGLRLVTRRTSITPKAVDVARARFALGTLQSDALPTLAAQLLGGGLDSPSLRALAGYTHPTMSEVGPLFERAMSELGFPPLQKQAALRLLARHYAHKILTGEVEPYQGATLIWKDLAAEYEPFEEISTFVGLAAQIDDYRQMALSHPDPYQSYIEACYRDITSAAHEYLNGGSRSQ